MTSCLPCGDKSHKKKKTMSMKRKALITVNYDRAKHTYISLGAYLVQRETSNGLKFFLEMITAGAFLHQAGARNTDRLVSVNGATVDGLDFDNLLNAIKSLMPLAFAVERHDDDGNITPIVLILDIIIDDDLNPIAKFIGFFWNTTFDEAKPFIPIKCPSLSTYTFVGKGCKVTLKTTVGGQDQWMSVDGDKILFTTIESRLTLFTMYRYVRDSSPQLRQAPVIFSPTAQPEQCLSAGPDNLLKLETFDEKTYEGRCIASNERFLFKKREDDFVVFESTCNEGYYIAQDKNNQDAVMATTPTLFDPPYQSSCSMKP